MWVNMDTVESEGGNYISVRKQSFVIAGYKLAIDNHYRGTLFGQLQPLMLQLTLTEHSQGYPR